MTLIEYKKVLRKDGMINISHGIVERDLSVRKINNWL